MRHLRARAHLLVLPLLFTVAACGGNDGGGATMGGGAADAAAAGERATVTVATFDFQPDPLIVPAGTTVTFVNEDAIDHTVTAGTRDDPQPGDFDGQLPDEGATFELTLDEPGTYDYFCQIHPGPGMTGSIVVE